MENVQHAVQSRAKHFRYKKFKNELGLLFVQLQRKTAKTLLKKLDINRYVMSLHTSLHKCTFISTLL